MSINMITGIPGSGKSYYAVHALMRKGWLDKYVVAHNITGLKDEMFDSEHLLRWVDLLPEGASENEPGCFFTREFQEQLVKEVREKYGLPLMLIIDEAQNIFDKVEPETKRWLSYHRHLGQDIWMVAQHKTMIARDYRNLVEIEITGNKNHVLDHFIYSHKVGKSQYRIERLKKDEAVFRAYRSFDTRGADKKGSRLIWYGAGATVLAAVVLVYGVVWGMQGMFSASVFSKSKSQSTVDGGRFVEGRMSNNKGGAVNKEKKKGQENKADDLQSISLASYRDGRLFVQDSSGALQDIRYVVPGAKVLEYRDGCVAILAERGIGYVCRNNGIVKVKSERRGGQGGFSPAPFALTESKPSSEEGEASSRWDRITEARGTVKTKE